MFQKLRNTLKNQKGLTLIELLAVIVILGIIAAIAIPSIGGLINKTKNDAKVAEAVQIISSAKMYVTTNPTATTLDFDDLESYLDNVKDETFTVTVSKDATSGKFDYKITNHDAAPIVKDSATATEVTEQELLTFSGN
ncbi:prepilin-type N-terminal cleavage/methylation domain-containing protein [Bacillus mesophilum]|uniref:Prepilin-type N-terminal cleavage/methylation domain-containing protein n=1 Tax=Bacillus mesophilum TaxID=1071718 RepID=A0A7V7UW74_9BACI|nr:prepilin-type N-terminal cleavage/methylation domain-containing protein [Bacillus mesophilum]KAB2334086.1 prepilin-type N-terminal cleavage/methylation domain-containing protein [Bacillus mesophilum]